jgi:hypothetical protein
VHQGKQVLAVAVVASLPGPRGPAPGRLQTEAREAVAPGASQEPAGEQGWLAWEGRPEPRGWLAPGGNHPGGRPEPQGNRPGGKAERLPAWVVAEAKGARSRVLPSRYPPGLSRWFLGPFSS